MSFLAPWALWAAGAVSAVVVALHILASKNPKVTALPTTRFIPDVPLRATARALRLSDVMLMLLRVAAVMLVGVALARPELTRARRSVGRVVMVDVSRATASRAELVDSVKRVLQRGDRLIAFDNDARTVASANVDSLGVASLATKEVRGDLSAALVAAMRAASSMRGDADSVELVLVSPLSVEEIDDVTSGVRALWHGRMRVMRVAHAQGGDSTGTRVEVTNALLDDPVRASASFLRTGGVTERSISRIDRGAPAAADSAWAAGGAHVLVRWPAMLDSSGWSRRLRADTAVGVIATDGIANVVLVAGFPRAVDVAAGVTIAWWQDGAPAATERRVGTGCIRDVAIPIARAGDLALRESTRKLVEMLTAPCGGLVNFAPASDSVLSALAGSGPLVATRALVARSAPPGHLATWLLVAALALLLIEPLLRRQRVAA